MAESIYRFRRHLFDTENTYLVRDDALIVRRDNGDEESIPLREIQVFQLRDESVYDGVHVYACVLRTARRKLVIRSAHYVGLGKLESRADDYRAFVRALQTAIQPHAHTIKFIKGSQFLRLLAISVLVICPVLLLGMGAAMYASAGTQRIIRLLVYLLAFVGMAPGMLAIVRRGRPRTFDPAESLDDYLP